MTDKNAEDILRDYPVIKAQAIIQQENLLNLFPSVTAVWSDMPHGSGTSDSTMNFALKRIDTPLEVRQARLIEVAYEALTKDGKDLIRLRYYERWCKNDVLYKLHISEREFRTIRREALDTVIMVLTNSFGRANDTKTSSKRQAGAK